MSFGELLSCKDVLFRLEPEELAGHLLESFHRQSERDQRSLHAGNLANSLRGYGEEVTDAVMEGWAWLVREGLIVPSSSSSSDFYQISRRGHRLKNSTDVDAWRNERWLPKGMLHPIIVDKTWSPFIRGEYETAVFQAFKEVEVAVRDAGKFQPTDIGVELMRKAFDPSKGPLAAMSDPESERNALAHLFAGAMGSYKNPSSHRHVKLAASEAAEMIVMASHLLRIVDSRR